MFTRSLWWRRALVVALVALVTVPPGVWADEGPGKGDGKEKTDSGGPLGRPTDQTTYGWILAPTPEVARLFTHSSGGGVTHFYVPATPGATFALDTTDAGQMRSCALGICVESGDFDVVFFHARGDGSADVTGRFSAVGAESGVVPETTTFGLVFLKTPGTSTTSKGFEFYYYEAD